MKKIFCFPALELFHCLPLWKTELFVSSRAFLLSTPTFLLSTHVENSEATWKKATKCNKLVKLQHYVKLISCFTKISWNFCGAAVVAILSPYLLCSLVKLVGKKDQKKPETSGGPKLVPVKGHSFTTFTKFCTLLTTYFSQIDICEGISLL
jgi:hypothetical protein